MSTAAAFRRLLEEGDVDAVLSAWDELAPGMPRPKSRADAEITMHMARTASATVGLRFRVYSHRWLTERRYPSQLPDELRPSAEQVVARKVSAVGVAVQFRSPLLAPAAIEVRTAMNDAIEDCYAEGRTDPKFVRDRMTEARDKSMRQLFGGLSGNGG